MRIANIPQMAEITIKMVHNDAECSVKTRVLTAYGDGILVTPITFGDQILDYCSHARIEYKNPSTKKYEKLTWDEDFEVVGYQNNVNKGTMTVYIRAKDDSTKVSGVKNFKIKISAKTMQKAQ